MRGEREGRRVDLYRSLRMVLCLDIVGLDVLWAEIRFGGSLVFLEY